MPWLRVRIAALLALLALASAAAIQPDDKHQLKAEIRNELLEELQTLLQRSTRSVSAADASSSPDSAAGHSRARRFLNGVFELVPRETAA